MAIVGVYQIPDESGDRDDKRTERTLTFNVFVDAIEADEDVLEASDGITTIPPVNAVIKGYRVQKKDFKRSQDEPLLSVVTCHLSDALAELSKPSGKEKTNIDIDIADEPYEEPVYLDRNNKPIANTAGQPFSNQPTKTYYDERITVSFTTGEVDQANIETCRGNTNSGTVSMTVKGYKRSFAANTLKLVSTPVKVRVVEGSDYNWDVKYVLVYRKDTWTRKILSMGRMQKDGGKLVPIYLPKSATPCTEDVPLDKDGKAIIDGAVAVAKKVSEAGAGERCYVEAEIEKQVSFSGLLSGIK